MESIAGDLRVMPRTPPAAIADRDAADQQQGSKS